MTINNRESLSVSVDQVLGQSLQIIYAKATAFSNMLIEQICFRTSYG